MRFRVEGSPRPPHHREDAPASWVGVGGLGLGVGDWGFVFMEAWLHRLARGSVFFFGPLFFGPVVGVWVLGFGFRILGSWGLTRLGVRGVGFSCTSVKPWRA